MSRLLNRWEQDRRRGLGFWVGLMAGLLMVIPLWGMIIIACMTFWAIWMQP